MMNWLYVSGSFEKDMIVFSGKPTCTLAYNRFWEVLF